MDGVDSRLGVGHIAFATSNATLLRSLCAFERALLDLDGRERVSRASASGFGRTWAATDAIRALLDPRLRSRVSLSRQYRACPAVGDSRSDLRMRGITARQGNFGQPEDRVTTVRDGLRGLAGTVRPGEAGRKGVEDAMTR